MPLYVSPGLVAPGAAPIVAPSIVGTNTAYFSSAGQTGYSVAHVVPAGADCLAIAIAACKQSGSFAIQSVSWNGAAASEIVNAAGWTFSRGGSGAIVYALASPDPGSHTIEIAIDVPPDNLALYAVSLGNVDTASPVAAQNGTASIAFNAASLSLTLAPAAPSLSFGVMALAQPPGAASFTPASGVVELAEGVASGAAAAACWFGYRRETLPGSYGFGATCTQSSSCALGAVAFRGR